MAGSISPRVYNGVVAFTLGSACHHCATVLKSKVHQLCLIRQLRSHALQKRLWSSGYNVSLTH